MTIPPISDAIRLVIWVVVGLSTGINVFLGKVYEENLVYYFHTLTKKKYKGDFPEPLPLLAKLMSVVFFLVMIVGTGFASSAPRQEDAFVTQSLSTSMPTALPSETPQPTATSELALALAPVEEDVVAAEDEDPRASLDPLALLSTWTISAVGGEPVEEENVESIPVSITSLAAFTSDAEDETPLLAAYFPDGRLALFSINEDFELALLGEPVPGPSAGSTNELLLLPGGQLFASGSAGGQLSIWSYTSSGVSPSPHKTVQLSGGVNALALSPDNETLASGLAHAIGAAEADDSSLAFFAASGELETRFNIFNTKQGAIYDISFANNGTLIVAGNNSKVKYYSQTDSGMMVFGGEIRTPQEKHSLVLASRNDPDLFFLDGAGQLLLGSLKDRKVISNSANLVGNPSSITYHPTLDLLAVGTSDCIVYLLDAQTLGTLAHTDSLCKGFLPEDTLEIGSISFSPDGHLLIVSTARSLVVLNTYTREEVTEEIISEQAPVIPMEMPLLASLSQWTTRNASPESSAHSSVAVFEGSDLIAAGFANGSMGLFQVDADHQLVALGDPVEGGEDQRTTALQFMPGAQLLIRASQNGTLSAWSYSENGLSGFPLRTTRLESTINALALSPDGETLASGMGHLLAASQKTQSGIAFNLPLMSNFAQTLNMLNTNQTSVYALTFTLDGKLVSAGESEMLQWYAPSSDGLRINYDNSMRTGADHHLAVLASKAESNQIFVQVGGERLGLADLETKSVLQTSPLLGGEVTSLALHPTLDILAVGTSNCVVYLLDSNDLSLISTSSDLCTELATDASRAIGSLAFSAEGNYLLVGNNAGILLLNTLEDLITNPEQAAS